MLSLAEWRIHTLKRAPIYRRGSTLEVDLRLRLYLEACRASRSPGSRASRSFVLRSVRSPSLEVDRRAHLASVRYALDGAVAFELSFHGERRDASDIPELPMFILERSKSI